MFPTAPTNQQTATPNPAPVLSSQKEKFVPSSHAVLCRAGYFNVAEVDKLSNKKGGTLIVNTADPAVAKSLAGLEADIKRLLLEKTGSETPTPGIALPFRACDERKPDGSLVFKHELFNAPNSMVMTARSQFDISCVFGPTRSPCDPSMIEGGDLVVVEVKPFWYESGRNRGVSLGLGSVWLLEKGKVKIGRGNAGSTFASVDLGGFQFAATETTGDYE